MKSVEVTKLSKAFGDIKAVQEVSFAVEEREIFAFLGPNGAGKSTTIKMLCTLMNPSAGTAKVAGFDVVDQPRAVRRSIGLVFQERTLDDQLTAEENLRFHAVLYGIPSGQIAEGIDRVLKMVDLYDRKKDLVSTYSGGMARRLEVARALLHQPKVLFLDEPTIGLDPQTRARLWADVKRLRDEHGVTVFMTTHYMDEAEIADRIAIIDYGKIVALDSPVNLKSQLGLDSVRLRTSNNDEAAAGLQKAGYQVEKTPDWVVVRVKDGETAVPGIVSAAHVAIQQVSVHKPTLDEVFLHFTGHEIRHETAEPGAQMKRFMAARFGGRR
ncbi:MAG: ATP-binding cassette domain-containing protein [Thermoplasmatota archaeon]